MPRKTTGETTTVKRATTRRVTRRKKTPDISHEHIATRAYFLHLEQGGDPVVNWLQAEQELVAV